jgi:hypothetical protein
MNGAPECIGSLHVWATRQVSFSFFSGVVGFVFCGGFRKKRGAERGFLMVKSWWNAGERWSENHLKLATKNTPLF